MFKVTFKNKAVQHFNDRATVVTLEAHLKYPNVEFLMPDRIDKWVCSSDIATYDGWGIAFRSQGKAVRSLDDNDTPVYAERIAEARAKIKVYQFMHTLLGKIYRHHLSVLFGKENCKYFSPNMDCNENSIAGWMYKYDCLLENERQHLNNLLMG